MHYEGRTRLDATWEPLWADGERPPPLRVDGECPPPGVDPVQPFAEHLHDLVHLGAEPLPLALPCAEYLDDEAVRGARVAVPRLVGGDNREDALWLERVGVRLAD